MKTVSVCQFLTLFIVLFIVTPVTCNNYLESWYKLERFSQNSISRFVEQVEAEYGSILAQAPLSEQCRRSLDVYSQDLKNFTLNSVRMLDSSGKIPSGLLDGSWIDLGSFDQCMSLESSQYCMMFAKMPLMSAKRFEGFYRPYPRSELQFHGPVLQYMEQYAHFFRYMNITTGLCLPQGCSRLEIKAIAQNIVRSHDTGLEIDVDLCQVRKPSNPWLTREIVAVTLISIVLALNLLGTLCGGETFLRHFNFRRNMTRLLTVSPVKKAYPCLNGVKSMNMVFMIFVHIIFGLLYNSFEPLFKVIPALNHPIVYLSFLGPYTIDTFFLVTGLEMMSYFTRFKGKFHWFPYLALRWIRFVVCIGWAIAVYIILFSDHVRDLIGGPFWPYYQAASSIPQVCEKNWPSHIFLVAHYFDSPKDWNVCLMADWYLETDFVFAILFLLVLIPYLKGKRSLALLNAGLMVLTGCLAMGFVFKTLHVQSTWMPTNFHTNEFAKYLIYIHSKPWGHLSAYFVGVILAFALKPAKPKVPKGLIAPIWTLWSISLGSIALYEIVININLFPLNDGVQLAYGMLSKPIWSLIMAWLIYCLHFRLILKSIRQLFSAKIFSVLARVNLSALFVNLLVVRIQNATLHSTAYISLSSLVLTYILPEIVAIYLISFVFCGLIESPVVNILKSLFLKDIGGERNENIEVKTLEQIEAANALKASTNTNTDTK